MELLWRSEVIGHVIYLPYADDKVGMEGIETLNISEGIPSIPEAFPEMMCLISSVSPLLWEEGRGVPQSVTGGLGHGQRIRLSRV
ncbi:hypothetical protein ElyMa_006150400 [Elysia marginata]|uniref:Uncharacterized protein n=1 Tax=Elysia marginata TaxID=1093978 RepID=A0AAV4H1P4_9GAST|nr:hypothetical protein ElyMa_006150400 [Elysia marginata]